MQEILGWLEVIVLVMFLALFYYSNQLEYDKLPVVSDRVLKVMRVFAIVCFMISITLLVDIVISKDLVDAKISSKSNVLSIQYDDVEEVLVDRLLHEFSDGEKVQVLLTKIYDEPFGIKSSTSNRITYFITRDQFYFIGMPFVFLSPMLLFKKGKYRTSRGKLGFFVLNVMSGFLFIVSMIIVIKLVLVHMLHVVERM